MEEEIIPDVMSARSDDVTTDAQVRPRPCNLKTALLNWVCLSLGNGLHHQNFYELCMIDVTTFNAVSSFYQGCSWVVS